MTSEAQVHQERLRELSTAQAARSTTELAGLQAQIAESTQRLVELSTHVAVTEETAILQEVGVYQYRHPLTDAAAYQQELDRIPRLDQSR